MSSVITAQRQVQAGDMPLIRTGTTSDGQGWYISDMVTVTFAEPFGKAPSVVMQTNGGNVTRRYEYRIASTTTEGFSFWLVANASDYAPNPGKWIAVA